MNGLYIHVPFCLKKCGYCDFYSVTDLHLRADFIKALCDEIRTVAGQEAPENRRVDTVYFGGGTPSLLPATDLDAVLKTVSECYDLDPDTEITLEMNPGTVSSDYLKEIRDLGVNRLSVGVQSFHDRALSFLGRVHTAREAENILHSARDLGFDNVGIDIIHGLPGQTTHDLEEDLSRALVFEPAHLSCYMLSYEKGTPLDLKRQKGVLKPLSENRVTGLFQRTVDFLEKAGYLHYEISNFARTPSTRSRHNMKYWDFLPYRGFGPSAHSFYPDSATRCWNVRDIRVYVERISNGHPAEEDRETLTRGQMITEAVFLGLRKRDGLDLALFHQRFDMDFIEQFKEVIDLFLKQNLVEISDQRIRLSRKGLVFADHITARLVECIP